MGGKRRSTLGVLQGSIIIKMSITLVVTGMSALTWSLPMRNIAALWHYGYL